jgi:hypothetical protein
MSSINIESEKSEKNSKIISSQNSLIDKSKNNEIKRVSVDQEVLSDASFSISNSGDIDSFCENFANKSKDDFNLVYESTLPNAEVDLNQEIDIHFSDLAKKEPGLDNNIKIISSNYYKGLVNSITGGKSQNQQNLDKTNNAYTKYGSISAGIDEQTIRLKNDLSGVPVILGPDVSNITGNINGNSDKKKNGDNTENEFILKDSKLLSKESSSALNSKNKLDYKKTMSLEYSKEKEIISSSSQNKQSSNKHDSKSSKNMLLDGQK